LAFNGSEPIRHETLERFALAFASCGFRREALYPCYGLAEATLFATGVSKGAPPTIRAVQGAALEQNRLVVASAEEKGARTLVGCGRSWLEQKVVIVDPESSLPYPPDHVGEIWVSGPSVAQGYWTRPQETERTFHAYLAETGEGPFLRTGDLGFVRDGELFITGRLKDLIIIAGRNHYPQDIELTAEQSHPAIRPGGCVAFSVEGNGSEHLVVMAEVERRHDRSLEGAEVVGAIRQAVAEQHEVRVHAVQFLKTGRLPKTPSGKLQRHACRQMFLAGDLETGQRRLV
jgi:acyl-CoA synthetase (AMP-forming)/AMP-acid ligase II